MTAFKNRGRGLKSILFKDGTGKFLLRGETYETDKEVLRVDEGIVEVEATAKPKTTRRKTAQKKTTKPVGESE